MIAALLLLAAALADDELEAEDYLAGLDRPVRQPDRPGDCVAKAGALAGTSRDCDAVSVPPEYLAYLEATRVYAEQLELHLVACRTTAATDARHCDDALAWRDQLLEQQQHTPPHPAALLLGAGLAGAGLALAGDADAPTHWRAVGGAGAGLGGALIFRWGADTFR